MKKIYLSTVALEKNRWAPGRTPTFQVSDFLSRIKNDGFYGVELWQYHYTLANDEEREKLAASDVPFFFNTYISIEKRDDELFKSIGNAVKAIGATAVKYNFGRNYDVIPDVDQQIENLKRLTEYMPDNVKMLCECHANSVMEVPEDAGEIFNKLDKERFGAIIHLETDSEFADRCFECYGDRIWHIHCAYKGGETAFKPMDDGSGNVEKLLNYYASKGFDGSFALEFVKFEETAQQHYENAINDLKFLNTITTR